MCVGLTCKEEAGEAPALAIDQGKRHDRCCQLVDEAQAQPLCMTHDTAAADSIATNCFVWLQPRDIFKQHIL